MNLKGFSIKSEINRKLIENLLFTETFIMFSLVHFKLKYKKLLKNNIRNKK